MKFSYVWLKDHLETQASAKELAEKLCEIGFEVEDLEDASLRLKDITIAQVQKVAAHPDSDHLHVCRVFDGANVLHIVCGAKNVREGMKTALVHPGGFVPKLGGVLKAAKIRGVESQGMMCSAAELELGMDGEGILDLETDAPAGEPLAQALGLDDPVFTVSVTPNRGDCFSVRGLARELAAARMGTLKPLSYAQHFEDKKLDFVDVNALPPSPLPIVVETPNCPFFLGAVVQNVKNGPGPLWMRQRLEVAGQSPIDALVDITNFLSFDIGQPTHIYDARHIQGGVRVRQAKAGEELTVLNGQKCALSEEDVVVADHKVPLTLAGVMGGEASGCAADTTNVLFEAAVFLPVSVTKTGQRHFLRSESRTRFERGVDAELTPVSLGWGLALLQKMCRGTLVGCTCAESFEKSPEAATQAPVTLTQARLTSLSGEESLSLQDAENILDRLGFTIVSKTTTELKATPPSWRHDVTMDADLIEEVLRFYGYHHCGMKPLPPVPVSLQKAPTDALKTFFCARGLSEIYTLPFWSAHDVAFFSVPEKVLEVLNPLNEDMAFLQTSLLPSMLKVVSRNQNLRYAYGALFEMGSVFSKKEAKGEASSHQDGVQEDIMVAGLRFGMQPRHWLEKTRPVDLFECKADVLAFFEFCGVSSYHIQTENLPSYYHPNRAGVITQGKKVLAYFGEVNPQLLKDAELCASVVMFEAFLREELAEKIGKAKLKTFQDSTLQVLSRDFAFLIAKDFPAGELISVIKKADTLIEEVRLFDVFEGKNVEEGKKSLAVEVLVQPLLRTLTEEDWQRITQKIVDVVEKQCKGTLRSV
ncbi:phenylalanine--tRNA ligase beta subunit [Alphaproteobacteria bacterium]|nr:phenylalanine--tRNA ligase beta subunit [Alphaproteobacteria bacterium]GHS97261.1 phenylalanine--tRNA ligase beta subunit [Alphaproteobacteria bacterium]